LTAYSREFFNAMNHAIYLCYMHVTVHISMPGYYNAEIGKQIILTLTYLYWFSSIDYSTL